jgi:hypothetical protein
LYQGICIALNVVFNCIYKKETQHHCTPHHWNLGCLTCTMCDRLWPLWTGLKSVSFVLLHSESGQGHFSFHVSKLDLSLTRLNTGTFAPDLGNDGCLVATRAGNSSHRVCSSALHWWASSQYSCASNSIRSSWQRWSVS